MQYFQITFRYIHDLEELIDTLEKSGVTFPSDLKQAAVLTQYAIETRYPGHFEEITEDDYRQALEIADRLVEWAEGVISSHDRNQEVK